MWAKGGHSKPCTIAFPSALIGSWIRSGTSGIQTSAWEELLQTVTLPTAPVTLAFWLSFFCLYGHINSTQTQWAIIHHYVHYFKLWITLYLASRGLIKFLRLWHQSTVHWDALFIGCSSLVLYCPFSTCGISDFSKNLWFLLAWNSIGKLSTMYTCC